MGSFITSLFTIVAVFIAVLGLVVAAAYLLRPGRVPVGLSTNDPLPNRLRRILVRRRFAAAMMATIAAMFLLGVGLMKIPAPTAVGRLYFWLILLALLLWLVVLAMLDIVQIGAIRRELIHRSQEQLMQMLTDDSNSPTQAGEPCGRSTSKDDKRA